ncbi:hypothetical protein BJ508DRAFT_311838 [Ascobolus immersus RN42]|uniref:Uncharacterized protein n=1 Tax=Ascobolus immersus RN42 TaxID=1160509 RepID=A0A3N4HUJ1_ASCIM|nr:hypothetical protein BJ508DRAFT_311838 [Ascobolus immersus RN42]
MKERANEKPESRGRARSRNREAQRAGIERPKANPVKKSVEKPGRNRGDEREPGIERLRVKPVKQSVEKSGRNREAESQPYQRVSRSPTGIRKRGIERASRRVRSRNREAGIEDR